ncbi:hypothetical protein [Halegenticoccus soli]|uniref:hypothetical protein n=1 Tax=Halegenticoccus soli TaxID=1985678 RepID=UPI0018EB94DE|nr:hypothetical protein [Halegenticoccus soli]
MRRGMPARLGPYRLLLLFAVFAVGRRVLRGGDSREALAIPGAGDVPLLVVVAGGILVLAGAFALRSGFFTRRGASSPGGIADSAETEYACRVCGRDLERYRNRCPHCETRDPVGPDGEW